MSSSIGLNQEEDVRQQNVLSSNPPFAASARKSDDAKQVGLLICKVVRGVQNVNASD